MLITDYSEQNFEDKKPSVPLTEIVTAGMIFVLPILFLLIISAK